MWMRGSHLLSHSPPLPLSAFGQRLCFFEYEIRKVDPVTDIEWRRAGIANEVAGGRDAQEAKGQSCM